MNLEIFKSWLDSYGHAWEKQNSKTFADLFTDDATYHFSIARVVAKF